jgi:hypothetical protein
MLIHSGLNSTASYTLDISFRLLLGLFFLSSLLTTLERFYKGNVCIQESGLTISKFYKPITKYGFLHIVVHIVYTENNNKSLEMEYFSLTPTNVSFSSFSYYFFFPLKQTINLSLQKINDAL